MPSTPVTVLNTSLKITAGPKTIKKGKAVIIKGQLKDSNGKPIAGKKVILKANGKRIKTIQTNSGGKFSLKHKPKKTTKYTATFTGVNNYNKSSARAVRVVVKKKQILVLAIIYWI